MATVLVLSDTHLADGDATLEPWRDPAQRAFEQLLRAAAPGGELDDTAVEVIFAGDTFDFLLAAPSLGARAATDVNTAHAKWSGIAAAHGPWFAALRDFLRIPGRRATFLIGNHDLELAYPSIRARVRSAIHAPPGTVRFALTRAYRPLPDVVVEHGCQFDPWNVIPHLWPAGAPPATPETLETGDGAGTAVGPLALPWGSRYYAHVFAPFKQRFPYLDTVAPDLGPTRQFALLALLAPDLLATAGPRLADLLPRMGADAMPDPELPTDAQALFAAALRGTDVAARAVTGAPAAGGPPLAEIQTIYAALAQEPERALRDILLAPTTPIAAAEADSYAAMLFAGDDPPRYAIFGHTHREGRWSAPGGHALLNTGTWVRRQAVPTAATWTPALADWFADPHDHDYPGPDATRFTLAWLRAETDAATMAELIAWQGRTFVPVPDDVPG